MHQDSTMETSNHLFVECEYATKVRDTTTEWIKVSLPTRGFKETVEMIKYKTLEEFEEASDSSYVGRKARNWKHFKGVRMQYTEIVNTMNREMGETILMFKNTKKPSRCSRFLAKLCNYMFLLFINMLRFG